MKADSRRIHGEIKARFGSNDSNGGACVVSGRPIHELLEELVPHRLSHGVHGNLVVSLHEITDGSLHIGESPRGGIARCCGTIIESACGNAAICARAIIGAGCRVHAEENIRIGVDSGDLFGKPVPFALRKDHTIGAERSA